MRLSIRGIGLMAWAVTLAARADVVLTLSPDNPVVPEGAIVAVDVIAQSEPGETHAIAAVSVILQWDASVLKLLGSEAGGDYNWFVSGFLADPDGINATFEDGDAIFTALAQITTPAQITDRPFVVTKLLFRQSCPLMKAM